jgi:hypothetical protein
MDTQNRCQGTATSQPLRPSPGNIVVRPTIFRGYFQDIIHQKGKILRNSHQDYPPDNECWRSSHKGGKGGINVNPHRGFIASATDQIRSAHIQLAGE